MLCAHWADLHKNPSEQIQASLSSLTLGTGVGVAVGRQEPPLSGEILQHCFTANLFMSI